MQERDCGDNDIVSCDMKSPYCLNVGRLACASPCSSSALSPLGWVGRKAPGWEGGPPKDSIKGIRPPHSTMPGMQKRKKRKPRLKVCRPRGALQVLHALAWISINITGTSLIHDFDICHSRCGFIALRFSFPAIDTTKTPRPNRQKKY